MHRVLFCQTQSKITKRIESDFGSPIVPCRHEPEPTPAVGARGVRAGVVLLVVHSRDGALVVQHVAPVAHVAADGAGGAELEHLLISRHLSHTLISSARSAPHLLLHRVSLAKRPPRAPSRALPECARAPLPRVASAAALRLHRERCARRRARLAAATRCTLCTVQCLYSTCLSASLSLSLCLRTWLVGERSFGDSYCSFTSSLVPVVYGNLPAQVRSSL